MIFCEESFPAVCAPLYLPLVPSLTSSAVSHRRTRLRRATSCGERCLRLRRPSRLPLARCSLAFPSRYELFLTEDPMLEWVGGCPPRLHLSLNPWRTAPRRGPLRPLWCLFGDLCRIFALSSAWYLIPPACRLHLEEGLMHRPPQPLRAPLVLRTLPLSICPARPPRNSVHVQLYHSRQHRSHLFAAPCSNVGVQ